MAETKLDDFVAFLAVAKARSFTAAAAKLGVAQPSLSATIRNLEARLGLRLLTRTTRSVALTEVGERLLQAVGPRIEEITAEIAALSAFRGKPAGTIRITADEYAARAILWPVVHRLLASYPDLRIEIMSDYGLRDIVGEGYDAGVRLGGMVAKDMVAVPIGPDQRMAAVATPGYFANRGRPKTPQDLTAHSCIGFRLPTHDSLYAWEFERGGREFRVRVEGQFVFNSAPMILDAVLDGVGVAFLPQHQVQAHLDAGQLVRVLANWCPPYAGYQLYYPTRRQPSPAFALLIEALRYRPSA